MKEKLLLFFRALFWHISRGCPKSSKQEILYRYNICIDCSSYDEKLKICTECGCNIKKHKAFLNKLAWADQSCPLNKW